jgi:opacity protein-like surface antigen
MKKYIIISALLLGLLGSVCAQDDAESFGPAAGDFSGAVLFGTGSFLDAWPNLVIPSAPYNNSSWSVSGYAPYQSTVEANYNYISNMVGVEGRFFVTNRIALKMSGGAIYRGTPPRDNLPGVIDPNSPNAAWIPYYEAVQQDESVDFNFNLGGDFIFPSKKFERIFPYVGANIPLLYGRRTQFDPTITFESDGSFVIADVGMRHVEVVGFGLQAVAGVDYYIAKGLYFGFEFKPISYVYAFNRKFPAPGLEPLEADTHTWSVFSQIYCKLGFRF